MGGNSRFGNKRERQSATLTHAGECKLAYVERAAGLALAGDQQRNIDMTMRGASLNQTAGAAEDALIGPMQREGWSGCGGGHKCFMKIDSLSVSSTSRVGPRKDARPVEGRASQRERGTENIRSTFHLRYWNESKRTWLSAEQSCDCWGFRMQERVRWCIDLWQSKKSINNSQISSVRNLEPIFFTTTYVKTNWIVWGLNIN